MRLSELVLPFSVTAESMEIELPARYFCTQDNCIGISVDLAPGGSAVAFHFWNDYVGPEVIKSSLGKFPQLLRALKMGPVELNQGTGYVQAVITVDPTKYSRFREALKGPLWDAYRTVYKRVKKLR